MTLPKQSRCAQRTAKRGMGLEGVLKPNMKLGEMAGCLLLSISS
jgi:hypothetical protein